MSCSIPLSRPDICKKERELVLGVLKTPYLSLGPNLKKFEARVSSYIGTRYAVAVFSGTAGLHLVIRALGIKDGDEVIATPFSFIASSIGVLYEKARPVFVDIDSQTLTIDVDKAERAITKETKAILAVDVFGHPAESDKLQRIAKDYRLKIIERFGRGVGFGISGQEMRHSC